MANDDTLLDNHAVTTLIDTASKYKNKVIVVGSTCDLSGNLSYGGREMSRKHKIIAPNSVETKECATFNGNIVLIPNRVVDIIGIIDPFFHHSFGDIEYGLRATKMVLNVLLLQDFWEYVREIIPSHYFVENNIRYLGGTNYYILH